jgi:signal transduction histidine kinase
MEYWIGFGLLGILEMFGILAAVRQANQMLREIAVFRAKTDFVSGVSHEMRTPLTTIKLYAEMLSQDLVPEGEKRHDYLRTIIGEADRLTRLIENVLDYAKISGRRREYRMERIEVSSAVEEAIVSLKGTIEQNEINIETSIFPSEILADRDALVQSLVNLIGNAIKYAGGRILVQVQEEKGETLISVQDWGPGIPIKEQRKIFHPFYRIGNELTRTASGSGLGLSLVREYAKAHGGRIELDSRIGGGSTFRLVLPKGKKE